MDGSVENDTSTDLSCLGQAKQIVCRKKCFATIPAENWTLGVPTVGGWMLPYPAFSYSRPRRIFGNRGTVVIS